MTDSATCVWTEDENGIYQTECEDAFEFNDGAPADNGMVYCCYCGKRLVAKRFTPAQCPKGETWFVNGGRCGFAHACDDCTGEPVWRVAFTRKQIAEVERKLAGKFC